MNNETSSNNINQDNKEQRNTARSNYHKNTRINEFYDN